MGGGVVGEGGNSECSEYGFTLRKSGKASTNLQVTLLGIPAIFPFQKAKSKLSLFSSSGTDIFCTRTD